MGPQIDYGYYFNRQTHVIPPVVTSITSPDLPNIDVIVISHEFSDHCNEYTLRTADRKTKVFAHPWAVPKVRSFNLFDDITEIPIHGNGVCMNKDPMETDEVSVVYVPTDSYTDPTGIR